MFTLHNLKLNGRLMLKNVMITCYVPLKSWQQWVGGVDISSRRCQRSPSLCGFNPTWLLHVRIPFAARGPNLLCRLRSSKIIRGHIWRGNWYGSKWQMTAAEEESANVCVQKESVFVQVFPLRDPSSGSDYKAAGILARFRLRDEKKSGDGSYVNNRSGLCWHLPASEPHPLTPISSVSCATATRCDCCPHLSLKWPLTFSILY